MKVLLTGGGTGGHVNPALAIADVIRTNDPDAEIAFVGTERGIENKLVGREGYPMYHVQIQGVRRSLSLSNFKTAYLVLTSPSKAAKILRSYQPDVVIGTGGYVCWPLLRAAASAGIPCMVHESNAYPGMAVRRLQNKVDVILTNFQETENFLKAKDKMLRVGNPLRKSYGMMSKQEARKKLKIPDEISFVILSFGGSLGAQKVNEAAMSVMKEFSARTSNVMHIHAGGASGYEHARSMFVSYGLERQSRLVLKDYIYEMPLYMAAADLVICRSGAMTLTELAVTHTPSILIPSPNVVENHQYKNAKVFADAGAAILLEEKDLNSDSVNEAVRKIAENPTLQAEMSHAVAQFAEPDAGQKIYEAMEALLAEKKNGVKS